MLHAKQRAVHIPHADGMEKLGHAENGKRIGLGAGQNIRQQKKLADMGRCNGNAACPKGLDRQIKESADADKTNQQTVKDRAGKSAVRKEIFVLGTGRAFHKVGGIAAVHT